jgi:hypothetical protein
MHVLLNLLGIKGHYIFQALLSHPQEALHKRNLVSYRSIPNCRPTQLFINQIYNINGGDMFRFLSVSHPQALTSFLNNKTEELGILRACYDSCLHK